jgi:hypothetical protein
MTARRSPGRKRAPVTHSSPIVRRVLLLADSDGRAYEDIALAAGITTTFISHAKGRTYHVSLPTVERLLWALGYKLEIVRRGPKEPMPHYEKSRR